MDVNQIRESAAKIVEQNRLWRDPAARRRFEAETGLSPIVSGDSLEVEAQHQSGRTMEYHGKFSDWAARQS